MQQPRVSTVGRAHAGAPVPDPTVRHRPGLRVRLGAALAIGLGLVGGLGIGNAQAAPTPVPEVAPADPSATVPAVDEPAPGGTTSTTAPPTSTTPTTAPTTAATATTAVVIADVATGAPPLVPQLASQGAIPGTGTASLVRPSRVELPVTGGGGTALATLAASVVAAGAVLIGVARRRHTSVTGM